MVSKISNITTDSCDNEKVFGFWIVIFSTSDSSRLPANNYHSQMSPCNGAENRQHYMNTALYK